MTKVGVAILGATGTVGQRFIQLLQDHPYFEIRALAASPRSAGKPYHEAVNWKLSTPIPASVAQMVVKLCEPSAISQDDVQVVFSGLDSDVAGPIEIAFRDADYGVFSNAKNHRMKADVPLCVPLVNTEHMDMIPHQRTMYQLKKGFLVTNANCSTTGLVVPLKALQDQFGPIDKLMVTTLQAISGAGYPGVPSLDIFDNVVPYISGEEDKLETETSKILGSFNKETQSFVPPSQQPMTVSATCNRVAVLDGHTECVSLSFQKRPAPTPEQVIQCLESFQCEAQALKAPCAPKHAILVSQLPDRPQPRLDRDAGHGHTVTVGRVRKCPVLDIKFTLLSHNTILGAAGSGIMNAEVAYLKGFIHTRQ